MIWLTSESSQWQVLKASFWYPSNKCLSFLSNDRGVFLISAFQWLQTSLSQMPMETLNPTEQYRNPAGRCTQWRNCQHPGHNVGSAKSTNFTTSGHLLPPAPKSLHRANNNQTPDRSYPLAQDSEKPQFTFSHLAQHKQSLSELRAMAWHFSLGQLQSFPVLYVTLQERQNHLLLHV